MIAEKRPDYYYIGGHWSELSALPWPGDGWSSVEEQDEWAGVTASGSSRDELRVSWSMGVKKLEEMPGFYIAPTGRRKLADWNQGDDWDLQKLREGRAPWTRRAKKVPNGKTVRVNIGELSYVSAEDMIYKAYAAAKITDIFESMGTPVELMIFSDSINTMRNIEGRLFMEIAVKAHDEPLNLGLIATAASPWTFRGLFFAAWDKFIPGKCTSGRGYTTKLGRGREWDDDIVIDNGKCLSMEAVETFIDEMEEREFEVSHAG